MRPSLYYILFLPPILGKAALLSKRQTSCPSNCFRCDGGVCVDCNSGWYGDDCSQSCPQCPGRCRQDTGHCLCPAGTFGPSCGQKCPTQCRRLICNNTNGHCDGGCTDGYYGDTCKLTCGHCGNISCDQKTGQCNSGCTDGWGWGWGDCNVQCILHCVKCTDSNSCRQCSRGYYGRQCTGRHRMSTTTTQTSSVLSTTTTQTSSTTTINHFSQVKGPSKATVDIIVGVSFGLMLVLLILFVLIYTKRKRIRGIFNRNKEEDMVYNWNQCLKWMSWAVQDSAEVILNFKKLESKKARKTESNKGMLQRSAVSV